MQTKVQETQTAPRVLNYEDIEYGKLYKAFNKDCEDEYAYVTVIDGDLTDEEYEDGYEYYETTDDTPVLFVFSDFGLSANPNVRSSSYLEKDAKEFSYIELPKGSSVELIQQ